jgi:TetR/AcrR family transcriptional regulator of autoinduction and epiphytic fitness
MSSAETSGRRHRKRSQTLEHLAGTAARLFEEHGFEAVTMERIAAETDVAKGTLYNHFPTKEAVLAHWMHLELAKDLGHLSSVIGPQTRFADGITHLLAASADWCERHKDYLPPYLRFRFQEIGTSAPKSEGDGARDMTSVFSGLILNSQNAGEMRTDLSAEHLALMFHHLYLSALLRWLDKPGLKLSDEFAGVVQLFMSGAASPSANISKPRKRT